MHGSGAAKAGGGAAMSGRGIGSVLLPVLVALMLMPWWPVMPSEGLDGSWVSVVEWSALGSVRGGADLAFTFGPLGYLYTNQFHPSLFAAQMAFWGGVGILLGAFFGRYWARTPLLVSLVLSAGLLLVTDAIRDAWLLFIPVAAAIESVDPASRERRWLVHLLLLLAILAGLVKFTAFIAGAALLIVADLVRVVRYRRRPYLFALFAAGSWAMYWVLSGDANWPRYLGSSVQIAGGYSAAMQVKGPGRDIVQSVAIALMVLGVLGMTRPADGGARRAWASSGVLAIVMLTVFLLLKAGYVRNDGHLVITTAGLVLLSILGAWRAFAQDDRTMVKLLAMVTVTVATADMLSAAKKHWNYLSPKENVRRVLLERPRAVLGAARSFIYGNAISGLRERRERALASVRAAHPLPALDGTIDIYNWDQAYVLAHGLDYSPRPVFQSYSAYTPQLIERNARFLAEQTGPRHVLFAPQSIDNRLPALADGKSWPLLWSRFDAVALHGGHALLKRRDQGARPVLWGEPRMAELAWGEKATLPSGASDCVWAEVDIRSNLLGRIVTTLFRAPITEIELGFADGSTVRRRFIPAMAHTGFLLSPYVNGLPRFLDACVEQQRSPWQTVESVSFLANERARSFFMPKIRVRTRTLRIGGARQHAGDPAYQSNVDWLRLGDALVHDAAGQCGIPVRWQEGKVFAHAPCQIPLRRAGGASLTIEFGMFPSAWTDGRTDGVRFEVQGRVRGALTTLASRELRPREQEKDRNGGRFELQLPEEVDALLLVTEPLGRSGWDWSYWGPIHASMSN